MKLINDYYNKNYDSLLQLATARTVTYKREYDPAILVSNAWEYCITNYDKIQTEFDVQIFSFRYITTQCAWGHSETNVENDLNCFRIHKKIKTTELLPIYDSGDSDEINEKINLEEYISTRTAVLEMFKLYLKETDNIKYRTYMLMLDGYNSSGLLANKLNITRNGAWNLLRNVRYELNKFKKRYNL